MLHCIFLRGWGGGRGAASVSQKSPADLGLAQTAYV